VEPEPSVLTEAIRELLANPKARQELAEKGRRRAAEFSWVRTAETMRELYVAAATRFKKL
jgi:glycosyltransferase involved in cell wall biosynthesis